MANIIYDYLLESKLSYPKYLDSNFDGLSEQDLVKELMNYRNYINMHAQSLFDEALNKDKISVTFESFSQMPTEMLLKQLLLYVDKIVVSDPIYPLTELEEDGYSKVLTKLMKTQGDESVNRTKLSKAIKFMIDNSLLVANGILKFFPLSLMHTRDKDIPIYYSKNNFADAIPPEYRRFFNEKVRIYNIENNVIKMGKSLELGRNILVEFEGAPRSRSMGFVLMNADYKEIDKSKGHFEMISHIPKEIPDQYTFNSWVEQSVNKSAGIIFDETLNELLFSKQVNSLYIT